MPEFLMVLPVLLVLLVGSFHLGYYFMYYHSVEKAVRNGARYLARVPEGVIVGGWGETRAKNLMLSGTTTSATPPLLAGWDDTTTITVATDVTRTILVDGVATPRLVVRVTAEVPLDLPVLTAFGFGDVITIGATHEERHVGE